MTDPATFRDLSKPMGAQTEKRLIQYKKRYTDWEDPQGICIYYVYYVYTLYILCVYTMYIMCILCVYTMYSHLRHQLAVKWRVYEWCHSFVCTFDKYWKTEVLQEKIIADVPCRVGGNERECLTPFMTSVFHFRWDTSLPLRHALLISYDCSILFGTNGAFCATLPEITGQCETISIIGWP